MKDFKYKTSFSAQIKPIVSKDLDKYLAFASESNFRKFLPKDIDFDEKYDFLGFAGEAFIGNRLNLNDDGVNNETAIRLANLFPLSFVDAEHSRRHILGVIVNASYAEFGTGKELSLDKIKDVEKPFSIVLGGIIWRLANEDFANAIEESGNPSSEYYNKFFLSWEIMFNEAKLIVMDEKQFNFEDGKVINDEKEISKLENRLKCFGGTGYTEDGKKIGRIITGNCIPAAIGIVASPAATVKPIATNNNQSQASDNKEDTNAKKEDKECKSYLCPSCGESIEMEEIDDDIDETEEIECSKCGKSSVTKKWLGKAHKDNNGEYDSKNINNNENIISQKQKNNVNRNDKIMPIATLKDITDESVKTATASEITKVLDTEIKKISDELEAKKNEHKTAIEAAQNKYSEMEKKHNDLVAAKEKSDKDIKDLQDKLNQLLEAQALKEKEEKFSVRMAYFNEAYNLSKEESDIIATDIKELNDESYASYVKKSEVLFKDKKKGEKTTVKASVENKDKNEDAGKVLEDAVKKGEVIKDNTVAATLTTKEDIKSKYKSAFGIESWSLDNRRKRV